MQISIPQILTLVGSGERLLVTDQIASSVHQLTVSISKEDEEEEEENHTPSYAG